MITFRVQMVFEATSAEPAPRSDGDTSTRVGMRLTHLVPALLLGNGVHRIARQPIAALPVASELTVSTEPLPKSALRLMVEVSGKGTQEAFDAQSGDAALSVASLLEEAVPSALQEQQAQLRMIGQAELLGDPAKLVSQFTPGQPLQVSFSVDVWPTLQLEPGSSRGLKFAMRRPVFEEDKYEAAKLELQQRFASPEGELPALDDALANEVSEGSGLTWEALDALLRERVERESAIQDSVLAFRAAEEAIRSQPHPNPSPNPNPSPSPNPNPNPNPKPKPKPKPNPKPNLSLSLSLTPTRTRTRALTRTRRCSPSCQRSSCPRR